MNAVDEAVSYAERGWALVPLQHKSKQPNHNVFRSMYGPNYSWKELRDRGYPAASDEIQQWYRISPNTGIGVLCGKWSNGLTVCDFDNPAGVPKDMPVLHTPTATARRGPHVYTYDANVTKSFKTTWGEVKASGYVVAPPSIHPNGMQRQWTICPTGTNLASLDLIMDVPSNQPLTSLKTTPNPLYPHLPITPLFSGCTTPVFTADELASTLGLYDGDETYVQKLVAITGMSLTGTFKCLSHPENQPSASLFRTDSGRYVHKCFHNRGKSTMSLTQAFACAITGRNMSEMIGASHTVWALRALHAAGVIEPTPVMLPVLPQTASEDAHKLWLSVSHLLTLKAFLHDPTTALARSFMAPWSGLPNNRFEAAKGELIAAKVVVKVGVVKRLSIFAVGGHA